MECLRSFLLTVLLFGVSQSQQLYNPVGAPNDNILLNGHLVPRQYVTERPKPSDSMRALMDISRSSEVPYEDYYDSLPYYDILDYLYLEDNITNKATPPVNKSHPSPGLDLSSTNSPSQQVPMTTNQSEYIPACDIITHIGCDITKFERCDSLTQTCRCLSGYVKETASVNGASSCTAAKFLHGHVNIPVPNRKVKTLSTQGVRIVRAKLWDYIKYLVKKYDIGSLLELRMRTSGVRSTDNPTWMVLSYEIAFDRSVSEVSDKLQDLSSQELKKPHNHEASKELMKIIGQMTSRNSSRSGQNVFESLIEINPCASLEHMYCDPNAVCRMENGSYTCTCSTGFQDTSPDPSALAGEVCHEQCQCEHQGVCVENVDDHKTNECSCITWYFGSRCQINGKELLIICSSSLACILIIIIAICCCYHACVKHRNRQTESSLFRFTPDTSILKLPRVWMESRYQDKDISPQSIRRMSIATECNPYFDGYILEDIPSCIQTDRSTDIYASHHQTTLGTTPGPATVSSHSIFRHY